MKTAKIRDRNYYLLVSRARELLQRRCAVFAEDMESFILDAPLEAFEYESTIHNCEDIIVGTHLITWDGVPQRVMGAATLKDGKVRKYHHMIKPV